MIKNKVLDNLFGQMVEVTKVTGRTENKMAGVRTKISKAFRDKEYGQMEKN